ncbi:hypothetical protein [Stappia sp.]|uniref:hypothetical protein n=1 Tax=Stappia sp. TaxID=1870903 RepID=UPI003D11C8C6
MQLNEYPEFDPAFYRGVYSDLAQLDDSQLWHHYEMHGRTEGRLASPLACRGDFVKFISTFTPALEIGPFHKPVLSGQGVEYFDVLDKDALRVRAEGLGESAERVPDINYVSPVGDLSVVDKKYRLIFTSHSIEHQPDLISHLVSIEKILDYDGLYAMIIPDCRYCFDHFLRPSAISDVMQAHVERRTIHSLKSVVEHRALTTHNDAIRHWDGDHGPEHVSSQRVLNAIEEWKSNIGQYIDVHSWQFTPTSFRNLISVLYEMAEIKLNVSRVYETPRNHNEFCVLLGR